LRVSIQRTGLFLATSCLTLLAPAGAALAQTAAPPADHETVGHRTVWLPESITTFTEPVDWMFNLILWITVVINIAVFAAMIWFLIKYRHRPGRHATFIHGNNKLETVWTLVPAVILALIAVFSQTTWSQIKSPPPGFEKSPDVVEIAVVGQQFEWNFQYPGPDGKLGQRKRELIDKNSGDAAAQIGLDREGDPNAKDDVVLAKICVVPVNKKVYIHLTSRDVIHSFFLPNFRVKQDAMPGLMGRVWFEATKTSAEMVGTVRADDAIGVQRVLGNSKPFDIVCAELCGQGHYQMRGQLYVVTEAQYNAFLEQQYATQSASEEEGY
jgi:cytochrome c oxidase subunit 2